MPSIDDIFPPSPRQLFAKAADVLVRVVCEFRFPRILRLDAEPPAGFQEALFKTFPLYERTANVSVPEGMQLPADVLQLIANQSGASGHQFLSEDRRRTIALSSQALSLEINAGYTKWEDFRELIRIASDALTTNYQVPFYSRISLRYQDVFHRETPNLSPNHPWTRLIKPDLLGKWPFADFESNVTGASHRLDVVLPDGAGTMVLRHGLVVVPRKGRGYLIDFEFNQQPKIETDNVFNRLDHFHRLAGRAFRWCITDELRSAMEPSGVLPDD
jgi:uncharacterized protein (TIGR04255 family)